jgi:hypothetical protein
MGIHGRYTEPKLGRYDSTVMIGEHIGYNCLSGMGIFIKSIR